MSNDVTDADWEIFQDHSYFDLWCLRPLGERQWGAGVHFLNKDGAEAARDFITQSVAALQAENEKLRTIVFLLDDCVDALLDGPDEEDKAWTKKKWRKAMRRFAALSDGDG